ncbi:hypothetical protein D3C86_2080800 [compost metagenome]
MRMNVIIPTNTNGRDIPCRKGTASYTLSGTGQYMLENVKSECSPVNAGKLNRAVPYATSKAEKVKVSEMRKNHIISFP